MLGAILDESSPPPYKEMTEKSVVQAPEKLPYFGERGEEKFGQPKKVDANGEEETNEADVEFRHHFAKFWPFRLLKTINLLLLLTLVGLCLYNIVDRNISLSGSKIWDPLRGVSKYNDSSRPATGLAILFLMAAGSMLLAYCRRCLSKNSSPGLAIMDLSFALIFIANLLYIGVFFGIRTYIEYKWFVPRLNKLHGNSDLVEAVEWNAPHLWDHNDDNYPPDYYLRQNMTTNTTTTTIPTPPSDNDWKLMAQRVDAIRARLLLDSAIVILSWLAILVNVGLVFATWVAIKRSRLCAINKNAIGCCQEPQHPEATDNGISEQQQAAKSALAYARFWPIGFVKLLLTSIATTLSIQSIYNHMVPIYLIGPIHLVETACLANWVLYVQKAWLMSGNGKQKMEELNSFRKKDCLFNCVCAAAFFSIIWFMPPGFKCIVGLLFVLSAILVESGS